MMRTLALTVSFALVVAPAFAQKKTPVKAPPAKIKCPVMKDMMVTVKDAQKQKLFVDYKKKRYYLCCSGCVPAFKADPAKYAKGAYGFPIPKKS